MDFVSSLVNPFNVAFALLVMLVVLVTFPLTLQPVSIRQNSLWLKNFLCILGHVGDHGIVREVLHRADGFQPLLLRHNWLDGGMLDHSPCMCL